MDLYGAIELGGTNTTWAVGRDASREGVADFGTCATADPASTIGQAVDQILGRVGIGELAAIGVGSFGPIDLGSGTILEGPKTGWIGAQLPQLIAAAVGRAVPVAIDTDVNAAALGEHVSGAGRGCTDIVYMTVGTGIGGGAIANGELVHGRSHPEMGHQYLPLHASDVDAGFDGICSYHSACLEGLACGPAIAERFGTAAEDLPPTTSPGIARCTTSRPRSRTWCSRIDRSV